MSSSEIKRTVPIYKVVAAAMVDMYVDINQAGIQQTLMFNAARGFRKLNNEVLKQGRRKVLLTVNKNTHTATLPLDFYQESFVGIIDCNGQKVPLRMRFDLTDTNNIDDIPCEDKCPKCNQNKNICSELTITEDTKIVVINDTPYEQTIVKKLYPNGDYYIETRTPVLNTSSVTPETRATGGILITHIGSAGAKMKVTVHGQVLGIYTQGDGDDTTAKIAAAIASQFNGISGYGFAASGSNVAIQAAPGLGSSINGGSQISVQITQVDFGSGGLGTQHPALAATITQFSGGVNAIGLKDGTVEYFTQKEFIDSISLKDCGCIENTQANIDIIRCNAYETYCCYYAPCSNITLDAGYEIFPETGLIKFGSNFQHDKVYLEYQGYLPKKNGQYQVPEVCVETLVNFIKFKTVENKNNVSLAEREWYWKRYVVERTNMQKVIGRFSLQDIVKSIGLVPKFDVGYYRDDSCCTPTPTTVATVSNTCNTSNTNASTSVGTQTYFPFGILVVAGSKPGTPVPGTSTWQDDRLKNALLINYIIVNNGNESRTSSDTSQSVKDFDIDTVNGIITRYQVDGSTRKNWELGDTLIIPPFFKLIN